MQKQNQGLWVNDKSFWDVLHSNTEEENYEQLNFVLWKRLTGGDSGILHC